MSKRRNIMEEIKQLVYNYAKAIHTQNEKDFKAL